MSTTHHTPHAFSAPLTSAEVNRPLGELDSAIETVIATGSGFSTTLTAQATAGSSGPFTVASTSGLLAGDPIYFGTGATFESRIVLAVTDGTHFTTTAVLTNTYAIGQPVSKSPVEIVDARAAYTTLGARLADMVPASGPDKVELNGGFTNSFDTDLWIARAQRTNPVVGAQAIYAQLRLSGNLGAVVHDALAAELRVNGASNTTFLNAFEASIRITGGVNAIADMRGLTANLGFEGAPTGMITAATLIAAQAIAAPPGGMSIGTVYGLWVEAQTVGTTDNWSIWAPTGKSRLGNLSTDGDATIGQGAAGTSRTLTINGVAGQVGAINWQSGGLNRWILRKDSTAESGGNAGSDLVLVARDDAGNNIGNVVTFFRATRGVKFDSGPIGFYAATPAAKPTVTGSRGGNAALASLLTGLATLGLLTDSSTA